MKINKKVSDFSETFEWTSLGLNQGPPDYELQKNPHSVRLCDAL